LHKKAVRADPLNEFLRHQRPLKVSNQCYPYSLNSPGLRIRIQDQGSGAFLIPFLRAEKPFFWLKYSNSLMRIQDPGSGMKKIQIRDQGSRMEKI
jgi:hypothetical protein